jgi:SAM-dependent methyltransferase
MAASRVDLANRVAANHEWYVEKMERYAARGLTPSEQHLFETYVAAGDAVLDMGVGTGRTVPALVERAGRYVGIDYAERMIVRARELFPGVDLRVLSAADLSTFADASFDVVLFIANGLDSMSPEARAACLSETARVLRPGGTLLISRHNVRGVAPLFDPSFVPTPRPWRNDVREGLVNLLRNRAVLRMRAFWTGEGRVSETPFVLDMASRRRVVAGVQPYGYIHLETLPCTYPRREVSLTTAWYFYAFRRASA